MRRTAMTRRDLVLRELGLVQWRPRAAAAAVPQPARAAEEVGGARARAAASGAAAAMLPDDSARAHAIAAMDWAQLRAAVQACSACALHARRKQGVLGVGDERADWLFVGEGPGAEEDERGEPFVGQAGRLLDAMLASIGLRRGQDVYIANVVKCRPPGNRTPEPGEAARCEPFLLRQIALLQPRLVIALGKTAALSLLRIDASIASLRGRVHDLRGTPLLVTYHPAYLLRTPADKAKTWEDLCTARALMAKLKSGADGPDRPSNWELRK